MPTGLFRAIILMASFAKSLHMVSRFAKRIPDSPLAFDRSLAELVDEHMQAVMPEPANVEHIHEHLRRYCLSPSPLLLIRNENKKDRCLEFATEGGAVVRWTDNSPAWAIHQAAYAALQWTADEFEVFLRNVPSMMFAVRGRSINTAKWYVAHIFGVKPDSRSARSISHKERIARFIRNVHPANHFYIPDRPKGRGKLYGEDIQVIQYMAMRNRQRYRRIWTEFLDLALAEEWPSGSEFGRKVIQIGGKHDNSGVPSSERHTNGSALLIEKTDSCQMIGRDELRTGFLDWTGNDESGRQHHNPVPLRNSPRDVRLHWKRSKNAQPKLIGCYRLDLHKLLTEGYVRKDRTPTHVRLGFFHSEDGGIRIQVRRDSPGLLLAQF